MVVRVPVAVMRRLQVTVVVLGYLIASDPPIISADPASLGKMSTGRKGGKKEGRKYFEHIPFLSQITKMSSSNAMTAPALSAKVELNKSR